MPLLGKKSFKPNPLPNDLKSAEEVFVIKETNEVFRSYDEYVNRIILYGFQVWSCQLTGKANLKYGEAVACEEQALKRLESFPKYLKKPILQLVHHSTCALQTLVQQCYKYLEKEYMEDEPVECHVRGKWHQGRISRIHHQTITGNKTDIRYDIECDSVQDCLKDVPSGDIKRLKKLPSEEMVNCFIRANTENPWRNDNSPWIVKTDMAKKYSLLDKLNDFSLVLSKTKTPSSKNLGTKGTKSNEKPKKKALDESAGHGKPGVNKTNLSQRKLDSFTKSIDNSNVTVSLSKLSDKSLNKFTPAKKDIVDICSSSEKDDDKTPSGLLRGTPVKCRLVLTPVKSPCRGGIRRSPACKKSGINDGGNKTKKSVVIEDYTNDVIITNCKSPKTNSGKKLKKSPKSGKPKKTLGGTEDSNKKYAKEETVSKKLDLSKSVTGNSIMGKEHMKGSESKKTKIPKPETLVQKSELVNLDSDSDKDFESSPHKLAVKPKQSSSKMKQMTLLDLTKKPDEDTVVPFSPKMKAKKQKTLSEMFSAAIPKDKPHQVINALISRTAHQVTSSSCLALNLHTTHQALVAEKSNVDKERLQSFRQFNKENGILNKAYWQKVDDNDILNSKPLPPAKPVNMLSGITAEIFGDIAMIVDFVYTFRDLLVPRESLHISIDNLSQALIAGNEGFPPLSRILFVFLQILLQDRSTKGQELGMQLAEMPLTQQSASEVSRLYLNSKFKMLTSYKDDKQLQGILESLQRQDFYNLTPEEKTKILVTLCHEVLSSDAMDDYIGRQLSEATELRKQKKAKQKEKNDKIREEKERQKKEKEEMQKQKEEAAIKKQLKVDELNKKETGSECGNMEKVSLHPGTETSNNTVEKKITNSKIEIPVKEQSKEVSEVIKTMRKRREDMATKDEKKLKEEKERLEKEEEEQWEINMAQCQYTLRLNPVGCDRNHARYWVFNGAAAGVFVEQGWWNLDSLSGTAEEPAKESREVEGDSDIEMVGETEVENKMDFFPKVSVQEWRFPDISYEWLCYSTVDEVQTLIDHLSHQGIRESALKKSLKEKLTAITDGITRRNTSRKPTKPETGEEGLFSSIKEELKDTAERLVCGNLAVLQEGLEEYQHTVDQASSIRDLASQLEKLLPAVLPQFYQGLFSKDKKGSEEAKQRWLDAVKQATTVSRLHLLLEILDSTVIWDLSAENARCRICRLKGVGTTLILCDDCNLGYHLQCLRPALSEVPEGHWSCSVCKPNERQSSRTSAKNYKEESGSEVDDEEEASEASIDDSDDSSEDESDEHEDCCHTCGEEGDLICCDTCPLVFHKDCNQPPLRNIPRGAWSCWQCRQPKNKKQKENLRGGQMTRSKEAKNKVKKPGRRDESSLRSNKLKRPHSRSSEESGSETVSKRTRQSRQRIEIADDKSARDRRRKVRACIEDMSDDESNDGKVKTSKTTQRTGKVVKNGRTSSRLQRICRQDSDDENEEMKGSKSNAKSFYGKSTRRARRQKISSEEDNDEPNEQRTNTARNSGRVSRRNRPQILDDSEDEDVDDEEESGKENRQSSLRKTGSHCKSSQRPARKSTRNQRQIPSSPEESEDGDEDTSKLTKKRAARKNNTARTKITSSSFEESEESGHDTSKRQALRNTSHVANKSSKVTATRKTRTRQGDKIDGDRCDDNKVKSNSKRNDRKGKGKKGELRNSSAAKDRQKQARNTRRTEVLQEETKRRRVNVDMDTCEQIVRDLLLHEDSWPFTQAVNLREVPDYLELIATPMDLGTIKEKLKALQYPDVDSFVADVRLVFSNSYKYNLSTSDVGQAGKNLEKYFDKLYKENFSNTDNKSKVQRKR